MNLIDAKNLANNLLEKHGLDACGWRIAFNNRKGSLGLCDYAKRTIELSKQHTPKLSLECITDTILHEIAHAFTPFDGHGKLWKTKCVEIGANPNRLSTEYIEPIKGKYALVVALDNGELVFRKNYYKLPKTKVKYGPLRGTWISKDWSNYYVQGKKAETLGRFKLIPMWEYEAWKESCIEMCRAA